MVTFRGYEKMRFVFKKKLMPQMAFYLDMAVILGMAHREIIKIHVDDMSIIADKLDEMGYKRNNIELQATHRAACDANYTLVFQSDSKIGVIGASTIQQNMNRCCEIAKITPPTSKDLKKLHGRLFVASKHFSKESFNILRRKWNFDSNSELAEWIGTTLPIYERKGKPLPNYKLRDELEKYTKATEDIESYLKFKGVDTSNVDLYKLTSFIYKL